MRHLFVLIMLASCVPCSLFAQDDPPAIASSSNVVRKNEIGTNYAPWLVYGLRGIPVKPALSFTYKRVIEGRYKTMALRLGVTTVFDIDPTEPSEYDTSYLVDYLEDESTEIRLTHTLKTSNLGAKAGMEWRYAKRNWDVMLGFDLYYRSISESISIREKRFLVGDTCLAMGVECPMEISSIERASQSVSYGQLGVGPFFGVLFRVSRNLTLSAETGFETKTELGDQFVLSGNKTVEVIDLNSTTLTIIPVKELGIYFTF